MGRKLARAISQKKGKIIRRLKTKPCLHRQRCSHRRAGHTDSFSGRKAARQSHDGAACNCEAVPPIGGRGIAIKDQVEGDDGNCNSEKFDLKWVG